MPSPHAAENERAEPILNPLAWVQFRLAGGPGRFWSACGLYAGALIFFNVFIYRGIEDVSLTAFASGSLVVTLFIASIVFVVVGSGIINRAILRDFSSDMITSHRSTGMTGRAVVLGYLIGPTMTILGITVVNWLVCSVLAELAGHPFHLPTIIFACVASLAALAWSLAILSGLSYRGKVSVAALASPLFIVIIIPPAAALFSAHPGVALLLNYRLVGSMTSSAAIGVSTADAQAVVVSMMFQVVMALIFCIAAARKFQRDDVAAFSMSLAYILLALCSLLCAVGMEYFPDVPGMFSVSGAGSVSTQVLTSMISLALLAILPISQACLGSALWAKRKSCDPLFTAPRPRPCWEVTFVASFIVMGILAVVARLKFAEASDSRLDWKAIQVAGYLLLSFFLAMLTIAGAMRFTYAYVRSGMWILLLLLIGVWVLPMIGDLLLEVAEERITKDRSILFTLSPIGSWVLLLTGGNGPFIGGLISQAVIAAAAQVLASRARY